MTLKLKEDDSRAGIALREEIGENGEQTAVACAKAWSKQLRGAAWFIGQRTESRVLSNLGLLFIYGVSVCQFFC